MLPEQQIELQWRPPELQQRAAEGERCGGGQVSSAATDTAESRGYVKALAVEAVG